MVVYIGTDESLKGDTFGGLIVAGVRADPKQRSQLIKLGVRDSKQLSDKRVSELAGRIMEGFGWHAESLLPSDYNSYIAKGTLTQLLNELHAKCYSKLKTGESMHVVDKYPGCSVGDIAETKAESKYAEVAAASIIARFLGLEQFKTLSKQAGFNLPMGSTHVKPALSRLVREKNELFLYAKLHFRNVQKVYK